ncbi:YbjQ family protein [Vibrio parahaemolyticus]|uniref:Heavy metal-binding domain-containing protein n=1 Tax=Vibrio parahaemolyticus TaxID=670 RepID=A0A7Y0X6F0_VIBPH|nr:YbjQ family protein [Vibrio parahaemolyticus]EGQ7791990.1 YbjQ family protein [Vibrio parahaemolyticus]EGQ7811059.1 YbjQ family protein [Vibrio parahaemolyticus]EHC7291251.1 YbjQ family protein [Vibrio parahaemolyticus]EIV8651458.1 hypothetical protein [Vibrio parahaemolyticus]EJE4150167.1 hypothetical protein [Vibrio parahaemolyticus]
MGLFGLGGPEESTSLIKGCTTLPSIPGKEVVKSLGIIQYTKKGIAGDVPKISANIFESLLSAARKEGADSVVNVKVMSGAYDAQGSQWQVTYVIAYGDAVVTK